MRTIPVKARDVRAGTVLVPERGGELVVEHVALLPEDRVKLEFEGGGFLMYLGDDELHAKAPDFEF